MRRSPLPGKAPPPAATTTGDAFDPSEDDEDDEDERKHGHDVHFLERLSRADADVADRALRLYRDPELVRDILERATAERASRGALSPASMEGGTDVEAAGGTEMREWSTPSVDPGDERVVIELASGPLPPCVIVTRKGVFVTCLGAGMYRKAPFTVGGEIVASAIRADNALDALRVRIKNGVYQELVRPVFRAGFRMTREHFLALRPLSPILYQAFSNMMLEIVPRMRENAQLAQRIRRPLPREPRLVRLWREYHLLAHAMILASCGGDEATADWFTPREEGANFYTDFFRIFVKFGMGPLATRALFVTSLGGRRVLPIVAGCFEGAETFHDWRATALSLLVLGARHPELRDEVRATLGRRPTPPGSHPDCQVYGAALMDMVDWALRSETEVSAEETIGFRHWAADWAASSARATSLCDENQLAPIGLARRLLVNLEVNVNELDELQALLRGMPFLGSMRPDDFFHPAAHANLVEDPYDQPMALRLCDRFAPRPEPVRAEATPGRNDPCPCGSGRKYKKCCDRGAIKS